MQTAFDTLPDQAKNCCKKIVGEEKPPLYSFFCENWETKPELASAQTYLQDYALFVVLEDKAIKLPIGWFKKANQGQEESLRKEVQTYPYDQIEDLHVERFLQSANIVLKLKDREVRIEKCQPPHADKFFQILRSKREKGNAGETEKFNLIYPVWAGTPVNFQMRLDGSIAVMFMKQAQPNRGPAEFTILVYKDQQVIKSYHFEPRQ